MYENALTFSKKGYSVILERDVNENQERSKLYHDRKSAKHTRKFVVGEKVKTRDYRGGDLRKKKVINGVIIEKIGPVRYLIDVGYCVYNRHVDQIEKIGQKLNGDLEKSQLDVIGLDCEPVDEQPVINRALTRSPNVLQRNEPEIVQPQRRSTRMKKPNKHYSDFVMNK